MAKIIFSFVLIVIIIVVGFFLYQNFIDSKVTNADLIHGVRQVGNKIVNIGKEAADSIRSSNQKTSSVSNGDGNGQPNQPYPLQEGSIRDADSIINSNINEGMAGITPIDTLNNILEKYRSLNLILEGEE
jgi:hypothetical protein